jgi:hypothetical protein
MYARAECLRKGIALECARAIHVSFCCNGARMKLTGMRLFARFATCASRESSAEDRFAVRVHVNRAKQNISLANRQTHLNYINQQAFHSSGHACRTLSILFKQSGPSFPRAIRSQQRCDLDSRRNDAYTSFPSNLQIGEAGGDAPV